MSLKYIFCKLLSLIFFFFFFFFFFFLILNNFFINSGVNYLFIIVGYTVFLVFSSIIFWKKDIFLKGLNKTFFVYIFIFFVISHFGFYFYSKIPYVPSDKFVITGENIKGTNDNLDGISEEMNFDEKKVIFLNNMFSQEVKVISTIPSVPFLYSHRANLELARARYFYNYSQGNNFSFLEEGKYFPVPNFGFPIITPQYGPSNWEYIKYQIESFRK